MHSPLAPKHSQTNVYTVNADLSWFINTPHFTQSHLKSCLLEISFHSFQLPVSSCKVWLMAGSFWLWPRAAGPFAPGPGRGGSQKPGEWPGRRSSAVCSAADARGCGCAGHGCRGLGGAMGLGSGFQPFAGSWGWKLEILVLTLLLLLWLWLWLWLWFDDDGGDDGDKDADASDAGGGCGPILFEFKSFKLPLAPFDLPCLSHLPPGRGAAIDALHTTWNLGLWPVVCKEPGRGFLSWSLGIFSCGWRFRCRALDWNVSHLGWQPKPCGLRQCDKRRLAMLNLRKFTGVFFVSHTAGNFEVLSLVRWPTLTQDFVPCPDSRTWNLSLESFYSTRFCEAK